MQRRTFLQSSAAIATASWFSPTVDAAEPSDRKFKLSLRSFSIGVKAGQREQIELAAKHGFEACNGDTRYLAKASTDEVGELLGRMKELEVVWGGASLPVEFRKDEAAFQQDLKELPARAKAWKSAGGSRMGTYLMPAHDELTYTENMKQHAERLRSCATVLADHEIRLGLEYVGPQTLLVSKRYPFLHTMAETQDLIAAIGGDNVGLLLDSWHWYTAGETVDDLLKLSNDEVVECDWNDAPKGVAREDQIDNQRELPMATGVIDMQGFVDALVKIGYDGPVRAEPFNAVLNAMQNDAACAATAKAMKRAAALVS